MRVWLRPAAPPPLDGTLKVASLNVLNYFTTLDQRGAESNPLRLQPPPAPDIELLRQQDKLVALCRAAGVRLVGPNSLGLLNVGTRYFATFSTALNGLQPKAGPIALATQSGAFGSCTYAMASLRGMGFTVVENAGLLKVVPEGNASDFLKTVLRDYNYYTQE